MIEVKNLSKKYGDYVALENLSFTIAKGQVYGLLGANGAGKSTTMNILTGYIGATSGSVWVAGRDVLRHPEEVKQQIGYLPELPPLYLDMKVEEYLAFAAELKKIPKAIRSKSIDEVIAKVQLGEVRQRLIKNLSKGFKQRVGLAQAILGWPAIIILDEPTVGLDPQQIIEIRQLIRELAQEHTVILSSHILAEVQEVCDYILIISQGRLLASETTANIGKLLSNPKTLELTVKNEPKQIAQILAQQPAVASYDFVELPDNEAEMQVVLQLTDNVDLREQLFFAFAKQQQPILGMVQSTTSLEEVFLELVQDNPAAKAAGEQEETADASHL